MAQKEKLDLTKMLNEKLDEVAEEKGISKEEILKKIKKGTGSSKGQKVILLN